MKRSTTWPFTKEDGWGREEKSLEKTRFESYDDNDPLGFHLQSRERLDHSVAGVSSWSRQSNWNVVAQGPSLTRRNEPINSDGLVRGASASPNFRSRYF